MCDTIDRAISTGNMVEKYLSDYLSAEICDQNAFRDLLNQHIKDIGIRLRSFLFRLGYESNSRKVKDILPVMAGIELIQTSTLIIDDILDDSDFRNNKPTVKAEYGLDAAVTSGITMASLGFSIISREFDRNGYFCNKILILDRFHNAHKDIYIGQHIDLASTGNIEFSEEEYFDMIYRTTGSFIQASLASGFLLWNAPAGVMQKVEEIGKALGIAYQLRDDVIDIIGETEFTGKPVAGDIRQKRMRLPVIHCFGQLNSNDAKSIFQNTKGSQELSPECVQSIIDFLIKTDSITYTIEKVREYCNSAINNINQLPVQYLEIGNQLRVIAKLVGSFDEDES